MQLPQKQLADNYYPGKIYLHEIQSEELLKAIEGSSKSYEEILDFIQGKEERGE